MACALILCAGFGSRLGTLTQTQPKPLQPLGSSNILSIIIQQLKAAGVCNIVINLHHLGDLIYNHIGDGQRFGVTISYSHEPHILETGGAIVHALPLLDDDFLVINGDILTDFNFTDLIQAPPVPGRLVLVDNPTHHKAGDFALHQDSVLPKNHLHASYTFAGISRWQRNIFSQLPRTRWPLSHLLQAMIKDQSLHGQYHAGTWLDLGRPADLLWAQQHIDAYTQ